MSVAAAAEACRLVLVSSRGALRPILGTALTGLRGSVDVAVANGARRRQPRTTTVSEPSPNRSPSTGHRFAASGVSRLSFSAAIAATAQSSCTSSPQRRFQSTSAIPGAMPNDTYNSTPPPRQQPVEGAAAPYNGPTALGAQRPPQKSLGDSAAAVGMAVSAFTDTVDSDPIATGRITAKIGDNVFAVSFNKVSPSTPAIEVGSRVIVMLTPEGKPSSGVIAKAQGNGTFAVLLDDNTYHEQITREQVLTSEGRPKFTSTEKFAKFLCWIQEAGVMRRSEAYSAACVLFQRGWRVDAMYLLEPPDVHCISHLNKSVRMSILDAADVERDKQRILKDLRKEQIKEREWKYWVPKYSSSFGAVTAFFGACSVFTWNYLNFRKTKRPYQLELAIENLTSTQQATAPLQPAGTPTLANRLAGGRVGESGIIQRAETVRLQEVLTELDSEHPRLLIVTGLPGSGKSLCTRAAADALGFTGVTVEIRGKDKDDPIRAIVKAVGVSNIDLCGDLFEFVSEACKKAAGKMGGRLPLVVLKLREADMGHVYDDAVTLVCDRRVCHIVIELDADKIEKKYLQLARTDYFHISNFLPEEAMLYAGHSIDPVALTDYFEQVSTNATEIDELVSMVHRQGLDPQEIIRKRVASELTAMKAESPDVQLALWQLAQQPFDEGVANLKGLVTSTMGRPPQGTGLTTVASAAGRGGDEAAPNAAAVAKAMENLRGYCMYHCEKKAWLFKTRVSYHCASMLSSQLRLQVHRMSRDARVRAKGDSVI